MPRRAKVFTPTDQEMAENDPEAGSRFVQFSLALSCREVQEADGEEREESGTSKVQSPPLGLPGII